MYSLNLTGDPILVIKVLFDTITSNRNNGKIMQIRWTKKKINVNKTSQRKSVTDIELSGSLT